MEFKSAEYKSGTQSEEAVVVVSGLPRSGTSMLMSMLDAGGLPLLTDNIRTADEDNPKGYQEFEPVKQLHKQEDKSWVADARGKAIKVISELLKALPDSCRYKVVFMNRDLDEIIASQNKMLVRRGQPAAPGADEKIIPLFQQHLEVVKKWLEEQPNFQVLHVNHREVVNDPLGQAIQIRDFLNLGLEAEKMAGVVDTKLYRNRSEPAGE